MLKTAWQSSLLEHCIGGVARLDFAIDNEMQLSDGAVPDFVIAPARTKRQPAASSSRLSSGVKLCVTPLVRSVS